MAKYYMNSDTGSDLNPGSEAEPFLTKTKFHTIAVAGDEGYWTGATPYRESLAHSKAIAFTAVRNPDNTWPIHLNTYLNQVVDGEEGNWTDNLDGTYEIEAGFQPTDVAWNWVARRDDDIGTTTGVPFASFAFLKPGTFGSLNAGEWAYSAGVTRIKPAAGGAAPSTDFYDLCRPGAAHQVSADGGRVTGGHFAVATDMPSSDGGQGTNGMPLILFGARNCIVEDVILQDPGDHTLGVQGAGNVNNTVRNVTLIGQRVGSMLAGYSSGAEGVRGFRLGPARLIGHKLFAHDGTVLAAAKVISGAIFHADTAIHDAAVEGLVLEDPLGHLNTSLVVNATVTGAAEGSPDAAFAMRFSDCELPRNSAGANLNSGSVLFNRTRMHLSRQGSDSTGIEANGAGVRVRWRHSELLGDLGGDAASRIYSLRSGSANEFYFCTLADRDRATGATNCIFRDLTAGGATVLAHGCVFYGGQKFCHCTLLNAAAFRLRYCIFIGFANATGYRTADNTGGGRDAFLALCAENVGNIFVEGTAAACAAIARFRDRANGDFDPLGGGFIAEKRFASWGGIEPGLGINGRLPAAARMLGEAAGHAGARQLGAVASAAGSVGRRTRVSRGD